MSWLRACNPKTRSVDGLRIHLETVLFPKMLGVEGKTVSSVTVNKFMKLWGFKKTQIAQQVGSYEMTRLILAFNSSFSCATDILRWP